MLQFDHRLFSFYVNISGVGISPMNRSSETRNHFVFPFSFHDFSRNTKHEKRINGRKIFANVSGGVVCDFVLFCFFGVASGRHVLAPSVYQQDGSNDGIPLLGQGMIHLRCFRRLRICPKCVIEVRRVYHLQIPLV
uniref:Uncharacterized protein n=1 Tax=Cacopsylla melanoneura TaxID=428564 RepID=A0A8D8TEQ4_9HEMI